jgi:hypothetical protein
MTISWTLGSRVIDVPCTVEVEHTARSLHAHVALHGVEVGPGDSVRVHDAPVEVGFGERVVCRRRATVVSAGLLRRAVTKLSAFLELTELYEVSFTPRRL